MNLTISIAIVLSQFAVPSIDRDEPNRNARLQSIAIAITRAAEHATCTGEFKVAGCKRIASDVNQVAAELIELARAETDFRSNVHRGECGPHQCDSVRMRVKGGGTIVIHRARNLWQMHRPPTWTEARWESIRGATQQATSNAAWEATMMLAGYRGTCHGAEGAFSGYGCGRCGHHKSARTRAHNAETIRVRLVALQGDDR